MAGAPTVVDVARVAGVSRQTVSNVLNSPDLVREETRRRVTRAISELGYQPHASARRLRTRRASTIGVRLDEARDGISGAVLDRFLHALTVTADERGFRVLLFAASDFRDEIARIRRLRDGADADAFVLTSTERGDERVRWMTANSVPFVTFGRPWGEEGTAEHAWVDVDGRAGTAAATAHLVETGVRDIAFLGWPSPSGTGDDRRSGWADTLALNGRVPRSDSFAASADDVGEAELAVSAWIDAGASFDALVCASDSLALGALIALNRAGRGSLPVIGFDNTPVARAMGFSSVEQRTDLVAQALFDLLLEDSGGIRGRSARSGSHRLIEPELVLRGGLPL